MLEKELNGALSQLLRRKGLLVRQRVHISPAEFDIVALRLDDLKLVNVEIKRKDWPRLLSQAVRGQLYCHFAIAVLPGAMKPKLPAGEFRSRGIGLLFYHRRGVELDWSLDLAPSPSRLLNRGFKREMYRQFANMKELEAHV